MCDTSEKCFGKNGGFTINFNQDYTSFVVICETGYRLFSLSSVDRVDEIFSSNDENTKIAERLFSSSLVAVVSEIEPNKLKVCHFKKGTEICNYSYPSNILTVRLNRSRLIVCLIDSIYIHNIRDMRLLHSIKNIPSNNKGLCSLSLSSHLAYPISTSNGELQIFDAGNMESKLSIKAHDSLLSAMTFSFNGVLLATASEKGTVIRVFCVKNGQKVHEFRRGVKRHVNIGSLNFSICANYVSASSNTETIHIFKIDPKYVEAAERRGNIDGNNENDANAPNEWIGYLTKAVSSYLPTNVVSDVLYQDRAFASVQMRQPGLKYECVMTKIEKETRLLLACEDGFLYIYDFDDVKGGECKLIRAHDIRTPLHDITEVDIGGNDYVTPDENKMMASFVVPPATYASALKGRPIDKMTESDKCRDLNDEADYPPKSTIQIFDEVQFPILAE